MLSKTNYILIMGSDNKRQERLTSYLAKQKQRILSTEKYSDAKIILNEKKINILIIHSKLPAHPRLIKELHAQNPSISIILICEASELEKNVKQFKNRVTEFITAPVRQVDIDMALNRIKKINRLQTRLEKSNKRHKTLLQKDMSALITSERVSTVQQIVDKLSLYIDKISENIQGDIRYFNELNHYISIHDKNAHIVYINQSYRNYLGDKTGCGSWEVYSHDYGQKNTCPVAITLQNNEMFSGNCIVDCRQGKKIPVFVHTAPIFNSKGEIELVLEVFTGTDEITQMSEYIQTTEQNYHKWFDAVPSYVTVLNKYKRITAVNRRFQKDFGEHTGRSFFDILKPASTPGETDPISKVLQNNSAHQGEMVLTSGNGKQYDMMAWATPISTTKGKLVQILVVLADKTEMRHLKDNLSTLGLMIGKLSHNLKGSLTGLDAALYLIDTGFYRNKPARIEEGLDLSALMVDRIKKMIFNVLYYAKKRPLNITKVNILKFAGGIAAHVENHIRGGNISFVCDFPTNDLHSYLDPELLRSALINILQNAREVCISDPSDKLYKITFKVFMENNELVFEISDNGTGMDKDQQKQLFSIFSSSKGLQGTGLGLFITHEVVKNHNGIITVDSEQGKGSCFSIKIPNNLKQKIPTVPFIE